MFVRRPKPQIHYGDGSERRAGLTNYASSCYMNSTLQAMAACQPLQDLLVTSVPDAQVLASSPSLRTIAGEESMAQHLAELPISAAWINLLRQLYKSKASHKTISTSKLHKVISRKNPDYDGISQQDAHEALLAVLDQVRLEEVDLIKVIQPPPARPAPKDRQATVTQRETPKSALKASQEDSDDSSSSDSEDEDPSPDDEDKLEPFIDTLFNGKLKSFIVCDTCKNVSISTEPFIDLSLAIQDEEKPRRRSRLRSLFARDQSGTSSAGNASDRPVTPLAKMSENPSNDNDEAVESSDSDEGEGMTQSLQLNRTLESDKTNKARRRSSLDPSYLKEKWVKRRERRASILQGSDSERARRTSSSGGNRRSAISPARFPFDATAPISEPDEETAQSSPVLDRNLTKAETAYLKTVLAEVPKKTPQQASPLDRLRVSRPGGSRMATGPTTAQEASQPPTANAASADSSEQSTSDLYKALQKFTAVEVLEDENAFQCKNCWKLTNPQFSKAKREHVSLPYAPSDGRSKGVNDTASLVAQLGLESDTEDERSAAASPKRDAVPSVQILKDANNTDPSAPSSDADVDSLASHGSQDADSEDEAEDSRPTSADPAASRRKHLSAQDQQTQPSSENPSASQSVSSVPQTLQKPSKSERYLPRKAHKRYLIDQLPEILIMHFNRFQQTRPGVLAASIGSFSFNSLRKIDEFVSFPETIDMSPFLAPAGPAPKIGKPLDEPTEKQAPSEEAEDAANSPQARDSGRTRKRSSTLIPAKALEADPRLTKCNYRLVAIVVHSGSMAGGHYISYVNVPVGKPSKEADGPSSINSETALSQLNEEKKNAASTNGPEMATAPPSLHGGTRPSTPSTAGTQEDSASAQSKAAEEPVEKQWLFCSDEEIRPANLSEVLSCKAYLLYYERIPN